MTLLPKRLVMFSILIAHFFSKAVILSFGAVGCNTSLNAGDRFNTIYFTIYVEDCKSKFAKKLLGRAKKRKVTQEYLYSFVRIDKIGFFTGE